MNQLQMNVKAKSADGNSDVITAILKLKTTSRFFVGSFERNSALSS